MIYISITENLPYEAFLNTSHLLGENLLAFALKHEKKINYKDQYLTWNKWGKPSLQKYPGVHYNISHSYNCVACVISDKYAVGIDVERIRIFSPYVARKVCTPDELQRIYSNPNPDREFFRHWTLKESYIKAIGIGLSYSMKNISFQINSDGEIHSDLSDCSFQLIEDEYGFITAVCYLNI